MKKTMTPVIRNLNFLKLRQFSFALTLLFAFPPFLSSISAQAQTQANATFSRILSPDALEAEQVLSSKVPKGSDPIHLFSFLKPISMTGALPKEFTPLAAQTFELKTVLLPVNTAEVIENPNAIDPEMHARTFVDINGTRFVRLFVHPLELSSWQNRFPNTPKDPITWIATPSSSSRSLYVVDKEMKQSGFVAKTSLNFSLAGVFRTITREQGRRAIQASAFYNEMMNETNGRIPNSEKSWDYFSESIAVGVQGDDRQLTIMRGLPKDYSNVDYIPFYALVADRGSKPRWIDELYSASGHKDRLAFVWHEIAKPLLDFHSMVHIDHGMVTELHQQNALLRVDPKTKKVLGIGVRDMDGHSIDYTARKHLLHLSVPPGGLSTENSDHHGYLYAREMPMLGYEYLKDSIFKNTMRYFLSPDDVRKLVGFSNAYILDRFNTKYSKQIGSTRDYYALRASFQSLYEQVTPADETEFFKKSAAAEKAKVPFYSRIVNAMIFRYYGLKQRFEKTGDGLVPIDVTSNVNPVIPVIEKLLTQIQLEAQGLVPAEALDQWLHYQKSRPNNMEAETPLSATDEKLLRDLLQKWGSQMDESLRTEIEDILKTRKTSVFAMRTIVQAFAARSEMKLRKEGATRKSKLDFLDEINVVKQLYRFTDPYWFTSSELTPSSFVGLLALPINVVALSEKVNFADGFELPPIEFMYHDELHSLGMISAQDQELRSRSIAPGSIEYYHLILERVRFTKKFVEWTKTLPDPVDRRIAKALWFDAFHEYFPVRRPYYQNFAVTVENLTKYVDNHLNENHQFHLSERLKIVLGKSILDRFVPGDFLAPNSKDSELFNAERVRGVFQMLRTFTSDSQLGIHLRTKTNEKVQSGEKNACARIFMIR